MSDEEERKQQYIIADRMMRRREIYHARAAVIEAAKAWAKPNPIGASDILYMAVKRLEQLEGK